MDDDPSDQGSGSILFEGRDEIKNVVEPQLKYNFGKGVYTHDIAETPSGDLVIHMGNEIMKDLSDCREQDNLIKFVPIDDVYRLKAEKTNGKYLLELPNREVIIENYRTRKQEIIDRVDVTLAKKIYSEVGRFGEVSNQLTPIRQILHWARTRDTLHIHEVHRNQRSDQTSGYLNVLQELGYIYIDEDGLIHQDETLDSLDFDNVPPEKFNEVILGDVIQRGYRQLVERLDLTILTHYPRISGAYYIDALQRDDPDVWLDLPTILSNLKDYFHAPFFKKLYIEEKLAQLSYHGLIEKEGDFVKAEESVYHDLDRTLQGTF